MLAMESERRDEFSDRLASFEGGAESQSFVRVSLDLIVVK
jgi:hypothetical protein